MIVVYVQDRSKAFCKYSFHHQRTDSSAEAIKEGIEKGKILPGDFAITIQVSKEGGLEVTRVIKTWAIYMLHGQIEAVPDRAGVLVKPKDWRYYREYMKFGRVKAAWYWIRKKKV